MRTKNLIVILALLAGTGLPAAGQAVSTQILGIVTDPTGAVIPGAEVKLTRIATGDRRVTATNGTGNYIFPVLDIGEYEVTCSAPGFKTEIHPRVVLRLQDKLRLNFAMQLGEQVEMIEVSSLPPLLHTDDATLGIVVEHQNVVELPLNGRNFAQLATLVPGVNYGLTRMGFNGQGTIGTRALPGQMVGLSANGQRDINQNITLDGVNAIEVHKNSMAFVPSIEAIQEFKIQTAVYSAEFGGNSGVQANVAIRSGTNDVHGTAFAFLRNDKLDARGFFLPEPFEKNHLRRNQFGGVASGPIVKERTFWLASYEGRRERRGTPAQVPVPTLAMRAGDFSEFLEPGNRWRGVVAPIRLPGTSAPLPNNIIPQSMINPVATNVLTFQHTSPFPQGGFLPEPNFDAQAKAAGSTLNLVGTFDQDIDADQYLTRIDHRVSDNDRLFGRYLIVDSFWLNTPIDSVARTHSNFMGQNAGFSYSRVLSPTAINDLRFGWNRFGARTTGDQTDAGFTQRDLGLDFRVVRDGNRILTTFEEGLPDINLFAYRPIRSGKIEQTVASVYEVSDSLSISRGRHNFRLGGSYLRDVVDLGASNLPRGTLTFNRVSGIPDAFAAFLLGIHQFAQTAEGFPQGALRRQRAGWYFLDDFKATPRLTLNLGVRWDYVGLLDDANGRIRTLSFEPEHLRIVDGRQVPMLVPNPDVRAGLYDVPWTQVMPRVGFAYRLSDTWVLRAGAGQYYASLQTNSFSILALNPPYSGGSQYFNNTLTARLDNPFVGAPAEGAPQALVMLGSIEAEDGNRSHFRGSDVWQWTLELEKSLAESFVVGMAYVGSAASNLDIAVSNFNNPDPGAGHPDDPSLNRRPFPFFTDSSDPATLQRAGTIRSLESSVSSNYNALQARAEKRYANGLAFTSSFTYQKSMGVSYSSNENGGFGPPIPQDPRNLRADYGRSPFDQQLRFVFSHVWELPWMRNADGVKGALLGGWKVNGIISLTSGLPVTVLQGGDGTSLGQSTGEQSGPRPHIAAGQSVERVMEGRTINRWFNTDAFTRSKCELCGSSGTYIGPKGYGTAGVGLFDAPGQKTWDFGLFKDFRITEGQSLQFRWEVFNFLNTPQFNAPNNIFGTSNLGQITSTVIDNREMQFGLKYSF